jgi:ribulose-phosphate 3-epimerase
MSSQELVRQLRSAGPLVVPSLLSCDFGNLQREIERVEAAGVQLLHLDVMDGHFVSNLSYGFPVLEAVRRVTELPLDVHLMIGNPQAYLQRYRDAGADLITIHAEAVGDPGPLLEEIRRSGAAAGIAINPPTPVSAIEGCLDRCDLVLVMSVMAGFGGQPFDAEALGKLREVRQLAGNELLVSVDGGINARTIGGCVEAGADLCVVGSALFSQTNYRQYVAELSRVAQLKTDAQV